MAIEARHPGAEALRSLAQACGASRARALTGLVPLGPTPIHAKDSVVVGAQRLPLTGRALEAEAPRRLRVAQGAPEPVPLEAWAPGIAIAQ